MYKVIITDDESIIVEGLQKLVPWEKYGCAVVATASGAAEAARLIDAHHPHILFADINMPDGDGLTMLAGLRSEHPNMQVTVLTGYRDFDYAQKAMRLGVCRFLLKPSKMEELEEALAFMCEKLEKLGISRQAAPPESEGGATENEPADTDEAALYLVQQAQAFIREQCCEKLALADVANHCYVSQWHLSKLLNRYTGRAFYDLLNTARIEKAKELMQDPALRIGDIAEMVGYSDTPHFSRIFKKLEGVSANEFRNSRLT